MMLYSQGMQKKALEAHGGLYNSDPATSVSDGPFILKEWRKGDRVEFDANPKYKGTNKPLIQKVINIGAAPGRELRRVPGQRARLRRLAPTCRPADNEIIAADPQLTKETHPHYGDFRTDYLFFDDQNPPFNNLKVRQAFSHLIPRDDLIKQIIKPSQGIPAFSFLMPGFPAANSDGAQGHPELRSGRWPSSCMADAGYPGGAGFPKLTLWLRNEAPVRQAVAQAIAASINQNLGISVDVSNKENKTFTDAMNAKPTQIQFGMVSYGFDFLDPVQHAQRVARRRPPQLEERRLRQAGQEPPPRSPATRPPASRCSRMPRSCWSPTSAASSSTTAPWPTCTSRT